MKAESWGSTFLSSLYTDCILTLQCYMPFLAPETLVPITQQLHYYKKNMAFNKWQNVSLTIHTVDLTKRKYKHNSCKLDVLLINPQSGTLCRKLLKISAWIFFLLYDAPGCLSTFYSLLTNHSACKGFTGTLQKNIRWNCFYLLPKYEKHPRVEVSETKTF